MAHNGDLSRLPSRDKKKEYWHAVIETPKGSHNKYDYDPKLRCFRMAKTLPEGMTFPFDFGFIPSTLGDDGDPLDVLVLMDFGAVSGALVDARLLGGITAEQKDKGKGWERNDRLIAVARHARETEDAQSLKDLRPGLLDEIADFFEQYNKLDGKRFRALGYCDAKHAAALIEKGVRALKKKG